MTSLLKNNRFYILLASIVSSLLIFRGVQTYIPVGELQIIRLEQLYAFVSMIFLYLALLAGPFCYTFPNFPFKKEFLHARRAIGVSAFYFAMLHGLIAFFGQLGGFHGLVFFDFKYLFTLIIGFLALIILAILALTSFDYFVEKMKFKNWKLLHRLVYFAGILILMHVFLLGSHFSDLSGIIPQISFFAIGFLLLLEVPRFDNKKRFGMAFLLTFSSLAVLYFTIFSPFFTSQNGQISFDIHAGHKLLAEQALQNQFSQSGNPALV